MFRRHRSAVLSVLLAAAGCVHSGAIRLGDVVYPPRPDAAPILFFEDAAEIRRPYQKIARLIVSSGEDRWDAMVAELEERARRVGADAVLLLEVGSIDDGVDEDGCRRWRAGITALAIRFTGQPAAPVAPPQPPPATRPAPVPV